MHWASSVSQFPDADRASSEAIDALRERLGDADASLLLAFASPEHLPALPSISARLQREFPGALLLGCSAHSVIGSGREIEEGPGLALSAACLPGVELRPFHVAPGGGIPEDLPPDADFLVLADPFTSPTEALIADLDRRFPGTKIGGLASGGRQPGENLLLLGSEVLDAGAVGVALHGQVRVESLVAQGCRPVGTPLFVTRAEGGILHELDGVPPVEILSDLFEEAADARERALFQTSLFLGIAMREAESEYGQGDYLIRNLVGGDPETGSLHVAAELEPRQIVQFHLRDAHTADAELTERLQRVARGPTPAGALLFSCLGRGQGLYGLPDHDSELLREHVGDVPVGGFFCNGEIGPVGGRTFLHGYTSAFALFHAVD